uniref:Uncharacterized protein n=1 Tax=Oryza barthii TaxID=65489 RepID=A0A0D3GGT8_9ORYZ
MGRESVRRWGGEGTGELETTDPNVPLAKKAKKCSSEVWSHFDMYEKKTVGYDGTEIVELWEKGKKYSYTSHCESNSAQQYFGVT